MKNILLVSVFAVLLAGALALAGCSGGSEQAADDAAPEQAGIDYMALVNKQNPLPDGWEDTIETVTFQNTVGDDVEVEKKAYDAYLELKADLEKEGVFVDLDSARRSIDAQQKIVDDFTKEYG